jgi:protein-L-isoaspartate O-methyltransferase
VLVHGTLEGVPSPLLECLARNGVILLARKTMRGAAMLTRIAHQPSGDFTESALCPCRLGALIGSNPASA